MKVKVVAHKNAFEVLGCHGGDDKNAKVKARIKAKI